MHRTEFKSPFVKCPRKQPLRRCSSKWLESSRMTTPCERRFARASVTISIWQFITSSASFQTPRTEIALCKSLLGNSTALGHICSCKIPLSRETKDKEGCSLVAGTSSSSWSQWCQTGFLDWANGAKQDSRLSQDSSVLLESTFLSSKLPKRLKPKSFYRVWTMMCHQWLPISWHVEHVNQ